MVSSYIIYRTLIITLDGPIERTSNSIQLKIYITFILNLIFRIIELICLLSLSNEQLDIAYYKP